MIPQRPPMIIIQMIWNQLSFLLGILGNVFVLYATICHKAMKMDKMSLWIIKSVSVIDICNCVFVLLPILITQYLGRWIFGENLCYVYFTYRFSFFVANMLFLNILSLNKLFRCLYPLRNLSPSRKQRIVVSVVTAILSAIPMCWSIILWSKDFIFLGHAHSLGSFQICLAFYSYGTSTTIRTGRVALTLLFNALPCFTMLITTTVILAYAMKMTNRPIVKKNILIVISICITFIITFLPMCVLYIRQDLGMPLAEIACSITLISVWINPAIYMIMNQSLRIFSMKKIRCCSSFWFGQWEVSNVVQMLLFKPSNIF